MGGVLLEATLATNRCFWHKDHENPLQISEPKKFELTWRESTKDYLHLEYLPKEPSAKVMLLEPHFYVDPINKVVGRAEGVVKDEDLLYSLLNAPKVSRKDAKYLSKKILRELLQSAIPLPAADTVQIIEGLAPQFKLQLLRDENQSLSSISMQIAYDQFVVMGTLQNETEILEDNLGEMALVKRDLAEEQQAIMALEASHFIQENSA